MTSTRKEREERERERVAKKNEKKKTNKKKQRKKNRKVGITKLWSISTRSRFKSRPRSPLFLLARRVRMDGAGPSTTTTTSSASSSGAGGRSSKSELVAVAAVASVATAGAILCGAMAAPALRRYRAQKAAIEEVSVIGLMGVLEERKENRRHWNGSSVSLSRWEASSFSEMVRAHRMDDERKEKRINNPPLPFSWGRMLSRWTR